MEQFPHLKLVTKETGQAVLAGGGRDPEETRRNKNDRIGHSSRLSNSLANLRSNWNANFNQRTSQGLAELDSETLTAFFKINPNLLLPTADLELYGIEIISEEPDGFIIGASTDNFRTLEDKIAGFIINTRKTGKIADFWQILDANRDQWRLDHILSEDLFAKWAEIQDNELYRLEVSIAFAKPIGPEPDQNKRGGLKRLADYKKTLYEREKLLFKRQDHFEAFISNYGSITSSLIEQNDSFGAYVEISGKGLKDLVVNYPFVFEVVEIDEVSLDQADEVEVNQAELEVLRPSEGSPIVGLIDSGIMEGHRLLAPAIDSGNSVSYINGDSSTADHVAGGGHGTRVAGAILFPNGVSAVTSPYTAPCFIRNLRVLDDLCSLRAKFPAELMKQIVDGNIDCNIFNLSVASRGPHRVKHMSSWASMIDTLSHEKDKLFIISSGNISKRKIEEYLIDGEFYPSFLEFPFCRVANPSQSSFGITVGSIDNVDFEDSNWKSIAGNQNVSAYSRIGQGIWGHIKPDLVEFGGGFVVSKDGLNIVKGKSETATELVQSTLHGGSSIGRSEVGTSYSAPKVTHIAAILKKLYPEEGINLIRALLVQGARLPGDLFQNPTPLAIRHFGYGLPSLQRVVRNTDYRITFYDTNFIKAGEANLYTLQLPESIRNPGEGFDILIEVSLSFTSKVRRTRQKLNSYLGSWLDWTSSRLDESFKSYSDRAIKREQSSDSGTTEDTITSGTIQWKIRERPDWGTVEGVNRNKSSVQKDWVILKSYQLPNEISFAVRGHKGWDKNFEEVPYAFAVSVEILGSEIPIYEEIRLENQIEIDVQNEVSVR